MINPSKGNPAQQVLARGEPINQLLAGGLITSFNHRWTSVKSVAEKWLPALQVGLAGHAGWTSSSVRFGSMQEKPKAIQDEE
jgi:hypothetical protein